MTRGALHPLAEDYLQRLRRSGSHLSPVRLHDLLLEIESYLAEAIPLDASDHEALAALERLGPPGDVVEAEQPAAPAPADRRGLREWTAVILLPLGGFAFGVGWLVGLILLWSSRLWTTRDKLIGTLIIPGGLATSWFVVLGAQVGTSSVTSCGGSATTPMHCTTIGGPSTVATVLDIALAVFFVLGPIVSAVYLARRAGHSSTSAAPARSSVARA